MKLKTKITVFVTVILILTIASITMLSFVQMRNLLNSQFDENLFNIAYSAAENNMVENALTSSDEALNSKLNDEIENIRVKTKVEFIVVMNMKGIRVTHPNTSKIGLRFEGGDETRVLTTGEQYVSKAKGSLGTSVRVFVPVIKDGKQVGAVCVGSSVNEINSAIYSKIEQFIPIILLGFMLGIIGATILSYNIKRAIFGLEPKEIAWMLKEKEAILENVKEGIIAVNEKGDLILFNKEAAVILGLSEQDMGQNIGEIIKDSQINKVLDSGKGIENVEIKIRPGVTILCKYNPLKNKKNKVIGAVVNFRDLTEIRKMAEELTGVKKMAWSLRAQNHEFMNKLHTISGLIQLEEYDEAIKFISKTARIRNEISDILTHQIKNVSIAALLFAKYNKAEEARIKLEIDKESNLMALPQLMSEEELGSVIGNLIENSFDAVNTDGTGKVFFGIYESEGRLIIEVKDNGPGIPSDIRDKIYNSGFSTKPGQRGYGMYIVKKIIDEARGEIKLIADNGTEWHVEVPMERNGDK